MADIPAVTLCTIFSIGGILIAGAILIMTRDEGGLFNNKNTPIKTYEEKFPLLRELNIPQDFKGTSASLKDGWSRYENKALGFSVEYLSPRAPYESFYNNPISRESYSVDLSVGDSNFVNISVEPSRAHTIDEWIKDNSDYNTSEASFIRRTLSGYDAVIVTPTPAFPITDEQMERRTYIIKDDILYTITTRDIPSAEYERIWNSFRFLE